MNCNSSSGDNQDNENGVVCLVEQSPEFADSKIKFTESVQEEWNGKWEKDVLTYAIIRGTDDIPGFRDESFAMAIALTTFAAEIPIKFRKVRANQNPDLRVEFKTPEEDRRFADKPTVLAYAYFPAQGKVSGKLVFNDAYYWTLHGKTREGQRTHNLIHVMIHELGHSLGLRHDADGSSTDIMDPYYNGTQLELSKNDIRRIQAKYGKREFRYESRYTRLKNWLFRRKRRFSR